MSKQDDVLKHWPDAPVTTYDLSGVEKFGPMLSLADIRKRFCEEINLQEGTDGWIYNPDEELGERFPICDFRQFNNCLRFVIAEARANRIDAETEI